MIETEYVKSMNSNYQRIRLEDKPEEKRYQYCIVSRGGIKGLLECSLHYFNDNAYLYYDITSMQNLSQLFRKKKIDREWIQDFIGYMKQTYQEIGRFLLDEEDLIWFPETVYQDISKRQFHTIYYPYYKGENGFRQLLEFIVEHIDYEDNQMVDFIYQLYENYSQFGNVYLMEQIYIDLDQFFLEEEENNEFTESQIDILNQISNDQNNSQKETVEEVDTATFVKARNIEDPFWKFRKGNNERINELLASTKEKKKEKNRKNKKNLLELFINNKNREQEQRASYFEQNYQMTEGMTVAEEIDYKEFEDTAEEGQTVYIETISENTEKFRRLFAESGRILYRLTKEDVLIGKSEQEVDLVLNNESISRIHARIYYEDGDYFLEDLNSTNGTFKNGIRLNPYEKKVLFAEDEIRIASELMFFR